MRTLPIIFIIAVLCPFFIENSYGQTQQEPGNSPFFIFVQTQIRNSDNQLIAYLEADRKITILKPEILNEFFDSSTISTITRMGEKFETMRIDLQKKITEPDTISKTILGRIIDGRQVMIASSTHDGYPIVPGDTVTSSWIIIRPAH